MERGDDRAFNSRQAGLIVAACRPAENPNSCWTRNNPRCWWVEVGGLPVKVQILLLNLEGRRHGMT